MCVVCKTYGNCICPDGKSRFHSCVKLLVSLCDTKPLRTGKISITNILTYPDLPEGLVACLLALPHDVRVEVT